MSKPQLKNNSFTFKDLSNNLQQIWEHSHVVVEYRLMVMKYIKSLSVKERQKYLRFEIQWNTSQKSHYFEIFRINMRRKIALFKVRTLLKLLKPLFTSKLEEICELLSSIRQMNVEVSQNIIDMVKFYSITVEEGDQRVLLYIWNLINNLHSENSFIIDSELKLHINFSKNYDPFFIYYYQRQKTFAINGEQTRFLNRLYNLSINQIYKTINLRVEVVSLKTRIQKRLKQLGCNYRKQILGTYMYRVKQEQKASPLPTQRVQQNKSIYKLQKPIKHGQNSRTMSQDIILKNKTEEPFERRSNSNQMQFNTDSKLGKIIKNGSMALSTSRVSDSLNLDNHLMKNRMERSEESRSQSRSERKYQRRLKIVQLEPLNIRIDKRKRYDQEGQIKHNHGQKPEKPQWRREVMNKPQFSRNNNKHKRYDFNPKLQAHRLPGFIKNMNQKIISDRQFSTGLAQQRPIKSRNILKEAQQKKQYVDKQIDNIQDEYLLPDTSQTVDEPSIIIKQPQIKYSRIMLLQNKQYEKFNMIEQEMQTQRQQMQQISQARIKVDHDCQTEFQQQQSQQLSQKQECNNPQQHLEAVQFMNKVKRADDEASLVTLDEQYFIDERLTPMKRFKIPMIRTITDEELKVIDKQRESIAKFSKKERNNPIMKQNIIVQDKID